jgi:hypothetical protein
MPEMKKFGDWDLVMNLAKNMSGDVDNANRIALMQIAARAEAKAVKHLRDQDLKWRSLSPKYLEWKNKKGLSNKKLIATSTMMQAVTSQVNKQGTVSFAGVLRKARNKDGEVIADIAKTMEYGSIVRGIPARPLWKPVFKEMREYIAKSKIFAVETLKQWRKRTGGKG